MATIKIQGNPSGSGSVTLTAPNTNSARTVTFPDEDIDLGALGGAGTVQAWVNFNGEGTVAIRGDGNVSSLTDLGVGFYRVNYSSSLTNANYSCPSSSGDNSSGYMMSLMVVLNGRATSSLSVETDSTNHGRWDAAENHIAMIL